MKWLRLYHEARNDAKLESLLDDEFRVWFKLLCFANEQDERGMYWITPDDTNIVEADDVRRLLRAGLIMFIDPQQIVLSPAGKAALGYRDLVSEFMAKVPS